MAGTLFGLGLSQQFDINGEPLSGALLFIYLANSTTPVTVYKNVALTPGQEHPWPIRADATGRIPAFWLADGSYHALLTDAGGVPQFDVIEMLAIGPSFGTVPAGTTIDPNSTLRTGDIKWMPKQGEEAGWVRLYGGTLGSSTSGANYADTTNNHNLFLHIWNNITNVANTICPVVSGRGANAAADWASNKPITLLDMRNRIPFGFSDMGGTNIGLSGVPFPLGSSIIPGSQGGETIHTLAQSELPNINLPATVSDTGHSHALSPQTSALGGAGANASGATPGGTFQLTQVAASTVSANPLSPTPGSVSASLTVATRLNGNVTQVASNNMPPVIPGTWYWRL